MKKVMVFGTFDGIHLGHRDFFQQAKAYGNSLIVVVARDKTIEEVKKHKPRCSEQERLEAVQQLPEVDRAILGNLDDKYRIIEQEKPSVICLGYDQQAFTKNLHNELKKRRLSPSIIRLKPYLPLHYKSSKLCAK